MYDAPPAPPRDMDPGTGASFTSAAELRDWAEFAEKAAGVLAAIAGPLGLGAWWHRRRARLAKAAELEGRRRELREAAFEAITLGLDRWRLETMAKRDPHLFTANELQRLRDTSDDKIIQARDRLWEARGFPRSKDDLSREVISMLRAMSATQRLSADHIRTAIEERRRRKERMEGTGE